MKSDKSVLIARNVRLTFKLVAKEVYVSGDGSVTVVAQQFGPNADFPDLTADYLDAICSKFYYGGYLHQDAIADVMLLNGVLSLGDYGDFYSALNSKLESGNITVISSVLFQ